MQAATHHLRAQIPPGRRPAGGKSAISENQPLGRSPIFPRPEDPKRKRRTSPRQGQNPPLPLVTHLVKHTQRCVTTFRFFPATNTNKWTSKTHTIRRPSLETCVTTVPPGPRPRSADARPPSRANSLQTGPSARYRVTPAETRIASQSQFTTPIESTKIGFVPSFLRMPEPIPRHPRPTRPQLRSPSPSSVFPKPGTHPIDWRSTYSHAPSVLS